MIIFIGDKPSKQNKDPKTAFVGTKSYKRLLNWIYKLDLSINEVMICNKSDIINVTEDYFYVSTPQMDTELFKDVDKVVALGCNVSKFLSKLKIEHFKMDHPSGLNRKLNDKEYESNMIKKCKVFIHGK